MRLMLQIWSLAVCCVCAAPLVAANVAIVAPPSAELLRALDLPASASMSLVAHSNAERKEFAIYECRSRDLVTYVFRSEEITDWTSSSSKLIGGDLELMPPDRVLRFFIVRFRGISNDIAHQKWRPDVKVDPWGPLVPVSGDSAKMVALYSLRFDEYADTMEAIQTYEAFFAAVGGGMTRDEVFGLISRHYYEGGERRQPLLLEESCDLLKFSMNPVDLLDPSIGFIRLKMRNGVVVEKSLSSDDPKTAQPGATDNPDDAQRLREDH